MGNCKGGLGYREVVGRIDGVRSFLAAGGRRTILSSCETGEDAVQNAYEQALDSKDQPGAMKALIEEQKLILKVSHDIIRELRDKAVAEADHKLAGFNRKAFRQIVRDSWCPLCLPYRIRNNL